jgi:hypothetical protein
VRWEELSPNMLPKESGRFWGNAGVVELSLNSSCDGGSKCRDKSIFERSEETEAGDGLA